MTPATPDEPIPEERVASILARAAELDRDRRETSSVEALRLAALEAGISQTALDAALEEYVAKAKPPVTPETPRTPGERNETLGILLSFFFGGLGAHRFYLKDRKGFFYLLFFWTLIPTVAGLVESFFMADRVRAFNRRAALEPTKEARKVESGEGEKRRPCPHCAELILPGARICRFCHASLNP